MSNYPMGDMISGIKNGYLAHLKEVVLPYSLFKEGVARVLVREGFLQSVKTDEKDKKKNLILSLKYDDRKSFINEIKLVSKPGLRRYVKVKDLKKVLGGLGIQVISTPQGVLSSRDARQKGVGGEIVCEVW